MGNGSSFMKARSSKIAACWIEDLFTRVCNSQYKTCKMRINAEEYVCEWLHGIFEWEIIENIVADSEANGEW